MYKTILVPHAGSPAGDEALKHAIHIAKSNDAKIIILHVLEEFPNLPLLMHEEQRERIKKQLEEAIETTKKTIEKEMTERIKLCEKENIKPDLRIITGFPEEGIMQIVADEEIDLIVMAKRRKLKGIRKLMTLGSVSRKIVENVKCPVLLIDIENL
ncbi:MAG TPA: universal stress protein [Nitrosopumilaceae archaeon]|nr:universal stress protein [Nitrosopumilaceae archaeon]